MGRRSRLEDLVLRVVVFLRALSGLHAPLFIYFIFVLLFASPPSLLKYKDVSGLDYEVKM